MSKDERRALQDAQRQRKALAQLSASACELVLVRHGETDWNVELRIQGQLKPGPPLNKQGQRQAEKLAHALACERLNAIYSSDLARAEQTAACIAARRGLEVLIEPGLRERHMGLLQGMAMHEAEAQQPAAYVALRRSAHDPAACVPGGGESVVELQTRAVQAVEDIAAKHPGQRVLLVVHGGVLHALHHHLMGHAHHGPLANCSMHTVRVEGRKWAVLSWNQTMHLAGVGFLGQGPVVAVAGAAITGSTKGSLPAGAGGFDSLNDRL